MKFNNTTSIKSQLQTGDMLVHSNGKVSTVMFNTAAGDIVRYAPININGGKPGKSFSYLSRFDDDLVHESKSGLSVVRVYRTQNQDATKVGDAICDPTQMLIDANLVWDFDEEEPTPMTVADIEAALGYKISIVG